MEHKQPYFDGMTPHQITTATDRILSGESPQLVFADMGLFFGTHARMLAAIKNEIERRTATECSKPRAYFRPHPRTGLKNLRTLSDYGELTVGDIYIVK